MRRARDPQILYAQPVSFAVATLARASRQTVVRVFGIFSAHLVHYSFIFGTGVIGHRSAFFGAATRRSGGGPAGDQPALGVFRAGLHCRRVGQVDGLIAQPLSFYLKEVHGWTALEVSTYLTIFNFPWIIKPLYGAFSDFVPLFGYRRKPYLLAANIVAAGAFLWVTQLTAPGELLWALELTAYAMAMSSTVCGAVLVENGQRLGESGRFVNQQWLWFNAATMFASIAGGQLAQRLPPTSALHVAAAIVAIAPLAVLCGTVFLISDKKTPIDLPALRATSGSLMIALRKRELWVVGLFLFLYHFNPGLNTPLYYHMTDNLKFSQGYIGVLGSIEAAGWIVGALPMRGYSPRTGKSPLE